MVLLELIALNGDFRSQERLPALLLGLCDDLLDLLRASAGGDEESVGHVDDDEVVYAQAGDEAARTRNDDATGDLLREHCRRANTVST